ncbi:signal transduction histidine kinase [Beggiatoa alba B18LD]|uniref:Sensory/regulatory protein RpfC n=1 Tax=Beggiatoa alba B18LD TaxID=395493 RepID=I3CDY5_9GAMM|nr:ATP-binding protein [Beggiatoa alba]EIJ41828.1 signal transduction histidine kinase [Beggiatoa alba B18LD]
MSTHLSTLPLHKRLSYQQARSVMLIALSLGVLFSCLQIYIDYFAAQEEIDNTVKQVINTVKKSAIQAVDTADNQLADSLAQGLFQYQPIYKVELIDSQRTHLLNRERLPANSNWRWFSSLLFEKYTIYDSPLYLKKSNHFALLRVSVDNYLLATHFYDRAFITLFTGVARNVVLALILLFLFHRLLTKPLLNMVTVLRQIDPKQPEKQRLICSEQHQEDELGQLVDSTNQLLKTIEEKLNERDRLLQEMQAAKKIIEKASAAKSEFLATMSHELKTPLNAILGMLSLTLHTPLNDTQQEYIKIASQSGHSLLNMINDILDFSMLEAGRLVLLSEVFSLRQTLEQTLQGFALLAQQKQLTLLITIADDIPEQLQGERTRFCQVLQNLVSNAIKFTHKGEIIIRIRQTTPPTNISVNSVTSDTLWLYCEVCDTGLGIAKDYQTNIFEIFSQEDNSSTRSHEGVGLGLALSKRLIQCMQGEIGLHSELQQGSCFWFSLAFQTVPIIEETSAEKIFKNNKILTGRHLLIAHPNPAICQELKNYVTTLGMQVTTTQHYLELLDEQEKADILLIDSSLLQNKTLPNLNKPHILYVPVNHLTISEYKHFLHNPIYTHQLNVKLQALQQQIDDEKHQATLPTSEMSNTPLIPAQENCVLLIENDIFNQKVALRIFKKLNLPVVIVDNDEEALHVLHAKKYTIIFISMTTDPYYQNLLTALETLSYTVPIVALLTTKETAITHLPALIQHHMHHPLKLDEFKLLLQQLHIINE